MGIRAYALTLTAPYGTGIAGEFKHYETRSWATHYRGVLAIHQGATISRAHRQFAEEPETARQLAQMHYTSWRELPVGKIVAVVQVMNMHRTETIAPTLPEAERHWGDYSPGRFAWELKFLFRVYPEVEALGAQRLWRINMPESWVANHAAQVRHMLLDPFQDPEAKPPVARGYRAKLQAALQPDLGFDDAELALPDAGRDEDDV